MINWVRLAAAANLLVAAAAAEVRPYTPGARRAALEKIDGQIAVFAGSRYAYVRGYKVRLDDKDLLGSEARFKNGRIYVPPAFAGVLTLKQVKPDPAPAYLENRWVYTLKLPTHRPTEPWVDLARVAASRGLRTYQHPRGLLLIGDRQVSFRSEESTLLDCVVALFDTPEKFADAALPVKYIPLLNKYGAWTGHIKPTPQQLALLDGPETVWPQTPRSAYNLEGFNSRLLGSKVPKPGVYPRLLFSEEDIPMLAARISHSKLGQKSMADVEELFRKSWWDPASSDGQVFAKLAAGRIGDLKSDRAFPGTFSGQKPGIYNSHINYNANCLTTMALYCLLTRDDKLGKQVADAIYNFYKLGEPAIDEYLKKTDSEFGTSPANASGADTHWRGMHALVPHMDLAFSLDFAGKWMSAEQKDLMRRVIAKATYGRRSYGQDGPARVRDVNWVTWDLTHFLAVSAIEGLEGFDPEVYAAGAQSARAFLEWGIDSSGQMWESNGKSGGGIQFQILSMNVLARRGDNLWGHPHWRRMLEAQVFMTAPNGKATVSSGTWGGGALEKQALNEIKAFYPGNRCADYLLSQFVPDSNPRKRLPGPTYPGMAFSLLYDTDWTPTTRDQLNLPKDWNDSVHGQLSASSDGTSDAVWMALHVRPNHYIGAGHHHADAGMFYFSGLGVNWFTESPFVKTYNGKYHNQVLIDGISEDRYNARARYLGATIARDAAFATADLSYAYSYKWSTQIEEMTPDFLQSHWEMETDPEIIKFFKGATRYKMRFWWPTYNFTNWLPTLRAPYNPVEYCFRSVGLVRGKHPYGLAIDDVKKDRADHLYQWTAMMGKGVRRASVPDLPSNQIVLAGPDGDAMLLISALGKVDAIKAETATDIPPDEKGTYDRVAIDNRAALAGFKVLLIPFRAGEPRPAIAYDESAGLAIVKWADQQDSVRFAKSPDGRTSAVVKRGNATIAEIK